MTTKYDKVNYNFDKETGVFTCDIYYRGLKFTGMAHCAPEDREHMNERTGGTLAEARATRKVLKYYRSVLLDQRDILKHLFTNIESSHYYDPHHYESRMIRSQGRAIEREIQETDEAINILDKSIKDFINGQK